MSIGIGLGDFFLAIKLAHTIYSRFKDAPVKFDRLSDEVKLLVPVLDDINHELKLGRLTEEQKEELCSIARNCKNVLHDVEATLQKFAVLKPVTPQPTSWIHRTRKAIKRPQWDPAEEQYHQGRIANSLIHLQTFLDRLIRQQGKLTTILNWISIPEKKVAPPLEGTGHWLLECSEVQSWVQGTGSTLLLHGPPGAGKTTMTSLVSNDLRRQNLADPTVGIAHLYCESGRQDHQTYDVLIASLLRQLAEARPIAPAHLISFYERYESQIPSISSPSGHEFTQELKLVVAGLAKVFIIVDALDECARGVSTHLLATIRSLQADYNVRFLATSRHRNALTGFERCELVEIRARDADARKYLQYHMTMLDEFVQYRPDLQEDIKTEITKAADGMFLLVQIYLELLKHATTPKEMRNMLKELPMGPDAPKKAFDRITKRIQESHKEQLAKYALRIVTFSRRPLSTQELQHALAVELDATEIDPDNIPVVNSIISACQGFVSLDEKNNTICLVHRTMQEYLRQLDWFSDADREIGKICTAYLSLKAFNGGHCQNDKDFEERVRRYPFYDYAAKYWGQHVQKSSAETHEIVLNFLRNEKKVLACSQALLIKRAHSWRGYSQRVAGNVTGLHLASYFGLSSTAQKLLAFGAPATNTDTQHRTPLSWAAEHGHNAVVKLLLDKGVNKHGSDNIGRNPIFWATIGGHETTVELLLKTGAYDINAEDGCGRTAFSWATGKGHSKIAQLLINHGIANMDPTDYFGRTPLSWAADGGDVATVELLLRTGQVELDRMDRRGRTPFSRAAEMGHNSILELLLGAGAIDVDAQDKSGRTPLSWAAGNGHEVVVKLLLNTERTDVLCRDRDGRNPFSWAVSSGHLGVARHFFSSAAANLDLAIDFPDNFGWTPLILASQNGHVVVIDWLLNTGKVNVAKADLNGGTAFSWAARNGQEDTVKLLLGISAPCIDLKDTDGRTAFSWAVGEGHIVVVQLLLDAGVEIDTRDDRLRSPVSWAAQNGHVDIMKLLLGSGMVDADSQDKDNRTPLSWAAEYGQTDIMKLLLDIGVDADSRDKDGRTPLSWAAEYGKEAVVDLLINTEMVAVYSTDKNGRTPLILSAADGYEDIVRKLVAASKEGIEIRDNSGRTALSWAEQGGCESIVQITKPSRILVP